MSCFDLQGHHTVRYDLNAAHLRPSPIKKTQTTINKTIGQITKTCQETQPTFKLCFDLQGHRTVGNDLNTAHVKPLQLKKTLTTINKTI